MKSLKISKVSVKRGLDADCCRKRRGDVVVQVRKSKKDDFLYKRRYSSSSDKLPFSNEVQYNAEELEKVLAKACVLVTSTIPHERLWSVQAIRWAVSVKNVPIEDILTFDELPQGSGKLIRSLNNLGKYDNRAEVLQEVAWVFAQVAAGKMTAKLSRCLDVVIKLVQNSSPMVVEESLGCIANIAGDSPELRDSLVQMGVITILLESLSRLSSKRAIQYATWALSNLVGSYLAQSSDLCLAVKCIVNVIKNHLNESVLKESCWALAHIAEKGDRGSILAMLEFGVSQILIQFLANANFDIVQPALAAVVSLIYFSDEAKDVLLSCRVLESYKDLLDRLSGFAKNQKVWNVQTSELYQKTKQMRVDILKSIGMLLATAAIPNSGVILNCDGLLGAILNDVENSEWEGKKAALEVIFCIITHADPQQIMELSNRSLVGTLCRMLDVVDHEVLLAVIRSLEYLVANTEQPDNSGQDCISLIEEVGGIEKIEALQEHVNLEVYHAAVRLIELHLQRDSMELEDLAVAPVKCDVFNTFSFGMNMSIHDQRSAIRNNSPAAAAGFAKPW